MRNDHLHLPGLNGLRAIAATAVVITHITLALADFGLDNEIFGTNGQGIATGLDLAGFGVTLFFTLSGFLITYLLLLEKKGGKIDILKFYIRRALRIWPLYYLYILLAVILLAGFQIDFESIYLNWYVFMTANFALLYNQTIYLLIHYWSLGVEEQFYIFFPFLLLLRTNYLFKTIMALITVMMILKFIFWYMAHYEGNQFPYEFIIGNRFHILLLGAGGAVLYYHKNKLFLQIFTNWFVQAAAWCVIFLAAINQFHVFTFIDDEIISMVTLILIIGQVTGKNKIINLENKGFDFVGKLSYGIYVFHPAIIFIYSRILPMNGSDGFFIYLSLYFIIYLTTIAVAFLSYQLIEKRFLKLKSNYAAVKNKSGMD